MQKIMIADKGYSELTQYIQENQFKKIFLVCGRSMYSLRISEYFKNLESVTGTKVVYFSDFQPNPLYESVVKGIDVFGKEQCDAIFAIGGGSAMDVAKCIKLYATMPKNCNYLKQKIVPNDIPLFAMPTTSGTGSEATRFAVIYYNGEKQSVADYSCIPSAVLMDATVLKTLPDYQKKATMMDAFCHAIESFWSVNSTGESKMYSSEAIQMILGNIDGYLNNTEVGNSAMLKASNLAGKAINITQTTAGHAMCYKLTSLYGISHGHAAALCVSKLWPYMIKNTDCCSDSRGSEYLSGVFEQMAVAMGTKSAQGAADKFNAILDSLKLGDITFNEQDLMILSHSVNTARLKNNPVVLSDKAIENLYCQILRKDGRNES